MNARILVAPLNWGLGHATRCIPIINALITRGFEPILASDGEALSLLKLEYPDLTAIELPSYKITYSKKGKHFKSKLILESPKILEAIRKENKRIKSIVSEFNIDGIISDNRLGVRHKSVPSVIITHQLTVLSGSTTWISSKLHANFIKKFDVGWVPDVKEEPSLSGRMGHLDDFSFHIEHLGVISRFKIEKLKIKFDLLIILSGPEPQRSILEEKLKEQLINYQGSVCLVQGKIEKKQARTIDGNMTVLNFVIGKDLERLINSSHMILARSGYTTILDLAKLGKKAFFIPTPGQYEQEYLADRLEKMGIIPCCSQDEFDPGQLDRVSKYSGFKPHPETAEFDRLFDLFKSK